MAQVFQIEVELRNDGANCGPSIYTAKEVSYAVQVGHGGESHAHVHFAIIAIYPAIMPLHKIYRMTVCNNNTVLNLIQRMKKNSILKTCNFLVKVVNRSIYKRYENL